MWLFHLSSHCKNTEREYNFKSNLLLHQFINIPQDLSSWEYVSRISSIYYKLSWTATN